MDYWDFGFGSPGNIGDPYAADFGTFGANFNPYGGYGGFGSLTSPSDLSFAPTGGGGFGGGGFGGSPGSGINIVIPTGGGGGGAAGPDVKQILTTLANQAEAALQGNLGAWQAQQIATDDAIARAWDIMDRFVSECMRYGQQGALSAAERDRRINPAALRWDWVAYYIDPMTGGNTPLPPVPGGGVNVGGPLPGGGGSVPYYPRQQFDPLLLMAGAVLLVLFLKK